MEKCKRITILSTTTFTPKVVSSLTTIRNIPYVDDKPMDLNEINIYSLFGKLCTFNGDKWVKAKCGTDYIKPITSEHFKEVLAVFNNIKGGKDG